MRALLGLRAQVLRLTSSRKKEMMKERLKEERSLRATVQQQPSMALLGMFFCDGGGSLPMRFALDVGCLGLCRGGNIGSQYNV